MPRYTIVENYIREKIESGELKEGDCVLPEVELASKFKLSRPTVRQAMSNLVNQNLLYRIRGKGTFVTKQKIPQESTRFIESYNTEMIKKGYKPKTIVLDLQIINVTPEVSKVLKIENKKVIYLKRLRYATLDSEQDELPVLLTEVFLPYDLVPYILDYNFEDFSLYEVLENNGVILTHVKREIEAIVCDTQTSEILEIEPNSPASFVRSIGYDKEGTVIEYSKSIYPAKRNKFIIEITK